MYSEQGKTPFEGGEDLANRQSLTAEQRAEVENARSAESSTRRFTNGDLEKLLYTATPALGNGFVRLIDYMGGDASVVQGARVSYGKGTKSASTDSNLIRYLMRHRHTTPFELAVVKFHIKAPIFVTRQWFRHRTASINEYSARYSILEREFYFPKPENLAEQSSQNRQGRGVPLPAERAEHVLAILRDDAARSYNHYLELLNEDENGRVINADQPGLARELARMNLPINVMTQFYWQVNLWNLLNFLKLRAEPNAQYEIRAYAEVMLNYVQTWAPVTHEAFRDYMQNAVHLSGQAVSLLRKALSGQKISATNEGLSKREILELTESLPELAGFLES